MVSEWDVTLQKPRSNRFCSVILELVWDTGIKSYEACNWIVQSYQSSIHKIKCLKFVTSLVSDLRILFDYSAGKYEFMVCSMGSILANIPASY